ncbi:MAG: ribosome biogenesis GTPase Der [Anaerolineae bacterium]|nr:ribosome biogenesis GTPase Der [Anaerolineae bacterium]
MARPIVALVGRPNVGKSALFNRLVGRQQAIVEDVPGTTRDRLYGDSEWAGVEFTVVDTGGLDIAASDPRQPKEARPAPLAQASADYVEEVRAQVEVAIAEADVIIFLVDVQDGLTSGDEDVAHLLRRTGKPVFLAANKADNAALRAAAVDFYALGLGQPFPISALHGTGTGDLLDAVVGSFPAGEPEELPEAVKIAIVGRPNVGKSSLLNALLGQERAIVSPIPGTTRDAIDTFLEWEGRPVVLIDTAGIRRRGKIERGIERYSVMRALRAIQRADVVLLLIDATSGVTLQDAHIAGYILEEAKSVVVVVNKWDLVEKDTHTMAEMTQRVREALRFLDYVPVLFVSARTRQRVQQVIPTALRVQAERLMRIPTGELNRWLQEIVSQHAPPSKQGRRLRLYYVTQSQVDPPTFVFFVNDTQLVHFTYQRYLENRLRERYPFEGTPLRLVFRPRDERG